MRGPIAVTLVSVTELDEGMGKTSESTAERRYSGVRFAPRTSGERTDPRSPAVINNGSLYRRGEFRVDSDDRIVIAKQHPLIDGTWEVDGDPGYWGAGVEVAIKRVGSDG